uniref:Uncharacterized protein n=1 Tax=Sorghum bicolor TaxID=4558 RepID=C6JS12_SORBI
MGAQYTDRYWNKGEYRETPETGLQWVMRCFSRPSNLHDKEFERCDADDEYLVEEDDTTPEDETEDAENEDAMNIIRSRIADALFSVR